MSTEKHILIVDDEPSVRSSYADVFIELGFSVTLADGGFQAIALVEQDRYDLILLDLKMPDLNGVQTCEKIKQICPDSSVLAMTAMIYDPLVDAVRPAGAVDVLHKPFPFDEALRYL